MKLFFKIIMVSVLSLVVLFTTTGFYIFEHHCSKTGNVQSSFSMESIDCKLPHSDKTNNSSWESEGCCKLIKNFYKISNPFEKPASQKSINVIIISLARLQLAELAKTDMEEDTEYTYIGNAPPIIRKEFIYLTRQLKLAPPSC